MQQPRGKRDAELLRVCPSEAGPGFLIALAQVSGHQTAAPSHSVLVPLAEVAGPQGPLQIWPTSCEQPWQHLFPPRPGLNVPGVFFRLCLITQYTKDRPLPDMGICAPSPLPAAH